jgi:ABC-type lipoprotein export system ATPase subunit
MLVNTKAAPSPKALIPVANLTKTYDNGTGSIEVLRRVDFEVHLAEMVAVMGPSSSGKSTLL